MTPVIWSPNRKNADKDGTLHLDCFVNTKQAMIYFGKQDGKGRW